MTSTDPQPAPLSTNSYSGFKCPPRSVRRWLIKQIICDRTADGGITKAELLTATQTIDPGLHARVFERDMEVILSNPQFQTTPQGKIIQTVAVTRRSA